MNMFIAANTYHAEGLPAFLIILAFGVIVVFAISILILPAFIIAGFTRRKAEQFKKAREGTVIARYDPPHDLSPAEVGYLYDLHCGEKELRATLFDLEQRGIIHIAQEDSIQVINNSAVESLADHEKIAIQLLTTNKLAYKPTITTQNGEQVIQLSLPPMFYNFQNSVRTKLKNKGYPIKNPALRMILSALVIAFLLGLWPLLGWLYGGGEYNGVRQEAWSFGAFGSGFATMLVVGLLFWPFYLFAGFMLIKLWSRIAGQHWMSSKAVRQIWYELEGYRLFLKQVEIDNIQFDSINQNDRSINKALPYAIALNLDTKWQHYFKNSSK